MWVGTQQGDEYTKETQECDVRTWNRNRNKNKNRNRNWD